MSIAATHWAFTLPIPATHKMVLLAYANHADERGETWPGMDRLIRHTSLSERAIRRSKKWLTKLGLIAPVTTGKRSDTFILSVGMEISEDFIEGQSVRETACESETGDTKTDYWAAETDSQAKKTDCVAPESSRTINILLFVPPPRQRFRVPILTLLRARPVSSNPTPISFNSRPRMNHRGLPLPESGSRPPGQEIVIRRSSMRSGQFTPGKMARKLQGAPLPKRERRLRWNASWRP